MTFASRSELGYDPTVTRAHDASGRLQYQFHIGDKIYQTNDIIYKAPRVWAVTELHAVTKAPIGETMVLKDFWHDAGAKSELEIQTEIFDALRKLDEDGGHPAGSLAEDARKFFLHIVSDAPVQVNGVDDAAPAPDNCSTLIHYAAAFEVHDMPQPPSTPHHTTKIHQRIIFAEECQSMYDLSKYSDVALAMAQLIQGLYFMRLAKYLHHDISPGNCLFHVAPDGRRQLKISDLEFAQPYDAPFNETGVTGTPGFMAVEYEHGRHLFTRYIQRPKVFFRYNFAHDLEAALWIYVWFIFTKVPDCLDSKASAQCRSDVQCCRDELLEVEKSLERSAFVRGDITSQESAEAVSALYNKVPEGACIVSGLKSFDVLALLYKSVEATEPLDVGVPGMTRWDPKSFYHRHYTFLQEQFMDIHHRLAKVGYRAISHRAFERAAAPRVEKRGREDSEDEEEEEEREVAAKKLCVRPDGGETDVQSPATGVQPD
ncbi:hypothetical protein BDZ89DRAFT_1062656 [Hymenopellis radicata]|nr:hypothetical protein BDZ89DRAFT_1062656 [Hymenopellis radicata]